MVYPLDVEGATTDKTIIKSIQRGVKYGTNTTVSISSVNLNKSFLNLSIGPTDASADNQGRGRFTSPSVITFDVDRNTANVYYNWEVIEYV